MVTPRHHVPCGLHRAGTAHRHASHRARVGGVAVAEDRGQRGGGGGEDEAKGALWDFVRMSLYFVKSRIVLARRVHAWTMTMQMVDGTSKRLANKYFRNQNGYTFDLHSR